MANAVDTLTQSGFKQTSWLRVQNWTYSGGDQVIAAVGDRFLIGERAKFGGLDDLSRLLRAGQPWLPVQAEVVTR